MATLHFRDPRSINVRSRKTAPRLKSTDNFTFVKGRHSLKFGVLVRYYQWIGYDSSVYAGLFGFTGAETQNSGLRAAMRLRTFCSDIQHRWAAPIREPTSADSVGTNQYFGQDDIRVNSKLTVNVGLRYEYSPWLNGYKGQLGTFDPTKAKPIIVEGNTSQVDLTSQYARLLHINSSGNISKPAARPACPIRSPIPTARSSVHASDFRGSRLTGTVVRGGFGIFYEPEGTSGRVNRNILPFLLAETVNQTQMWFRIVRQRTSSWARSLVQRWRIRPSCRPSLI